MAMPCHADLDGAPLQHRAHEWKAARVCCTCEGELTSLAVNQLDWSVIACPDCSPDGELVDSAGHCGPELTRARRASELQVQGVGRGEAP